MPSLTTAARGYGGRHQRIRAEYAPLVLAGRQRCVRCGESILPGEPWDLGHTDDRRGYQGPEHVRCNRGARPAADELPPERDGLPVDDPRWRVPWLEGLLDVSADATWPRLMTVPHPRAVDSLGGEFVDWVEGRDGVARLRWWQRLVAARLLEVDADGRLVWDAAILTVARQVGKSWLLRELCWWRIHQAGRFGEPQDVVHTGKDLKVCRDVQRPAIWWAKAAGADYRVRQTNGQEEIEHLPSLSRWMLRAKEAAYGYSVSLAAIDEAWKVKSSTVDESLVPTMVEREQPQLLMISTAHRRSEALMLQRRHAALEQLESGSGDLLIEWSAPRGVPLDDVDGWRQASPRWTRQREKMVAQQLAALMDGSIRDPSEPDPETSFRTQWLNQWPQAFESGTGEPLLPPAVWAALRERVDTGDAPMFVAVEDDYGEGAAVAAAARLDDGRVELDGVCCPDWETALGRARLLTVHRRVKQLQVGASMLAQTPEGMWPPPKRAGGTETTAGLSLLRDLAKRGLIVHDDTPDLDAAFEVARVREGASGLTLERVGPTPLLRALAWAVYGAAKPDRTPTVY